MDQPIAPNATIFQRMSRQLVELAGNGIAPWGSFLLLIPILLAIVLWVAVLPAIDPRQMNDLGMWSK